MDAKDCDSVYCVVCGRKQVFEKGTLTANAMMNFRCSSCLTSTLETNVDTAAHRGKQLLTEG